MGYVGAEEKKNNMEKRQMDANKTVYDTSAHPKYKSSGAAFGLPKARPSRGAGNS